MKRFTRSSRTRSNVADTSAIRDQFIRDLTLEANTLMLQLSQQFSANLQAQAAQYQSIVAGDSPGPTGSTGAGSIGSIGQLLGTGVRYLVSRPRTSSQVSETTRSQGAQSQFRVSQSQATAEAQGTLTKGSKNL